MENIVGRFDYEKENKPIKIDIKDKKILSILLKDSRTPLTQIAKKVQLSRDAISYRIKRLEKEGVILKFFPNIYYEKLGYYIFHVFFLVDEEDKKEKEVFVEYLKHHDHIFSLIEYSDKWDFEIALIARDLLEFDHVILEITSKFPKLILEKNKLELIRRFNSTHAPPIFKEPVKDRMEEAILRSDSVTLDEVDYGILRLLSVDCRMSTYAIGEILKVSADTISYRIRNLQKENIIKNFTILLDLSKLQYQWYTYSLSMSMFDRANEKKFEEFLRQNAKIIRSAKTLGGWDLLLYMVVENQKEFHSMVKDIKNVFSSVIKHYDTWVAYKEHCFHPFPKILEKGK